MTTQDTLAVETVKETFNTPVLNVLVGVWFQCITSILLLNGNPQVAPDQIQLLSGQAEQWRALLSYSCPCCTEVKSHIRWTQWTDDQVPENKLIKRYGVTHVCHSLVSGFVSRRWRHVTADVKLVGQDKTEKGQIVRVLRNRKSPPSLVNMYCVASHVIEIHSV